MRKYPLPKLRLNGANQVTIAISALNALTIAGAVLVGRMPNGADTSHAATRVSASKLSWSVPAVRGAVYAWLADIPSVNGVAVSMYELHRAVAQSGSSLLPAAANPKTIKIKHRNKNGNYYHLEAIELA
jgi:hypothetical protein